HDLERVEKPLQGPVPPVPLPLGPRELPPRRGLQLLPLPPQRPEVRPDGSLQCQGQGAQAAHQDGVDGGPAPSAAFPVQPPGLGGLLERPPAACQQQHRQLRQRGRARGGARLRSRAAGLRRRGQRAAQGDPPQRAARPLRRL
ncbi:unnamed protein product, partial [Prorocentrum cordatum]